jgi:serine phosphatase RsbU (regulator of sigma subunit)
MNYSGAAQTIHYGLLEIIPFTTHQLKLEKDDTIYIFTDGYVDQFGGEKGKKFKAAQLKETILSIQQKPLHEQKEILKNSFAKWKGNLEQVDDVCVIGVRV